MADSQRKPGKPRCSCTTPDGDGVIRHSGKLVTFAAKIGDMFMKNRKPRQITVCWHHRKLYKGWKAAR